MNRYTFVDKVTAHPVWMCKAKSEREAIQRFIKLRSRALPTNKEWIERRMIIEEIKL